MHVDLRVVALRAVDIDTTEADEKAAKKAASLEKAKARDKKKSGGGGKVEGGGSLIELGDASEQPSLLDLATPKSAGKAPTLTMEAGGLGVDVGGGGKGAGTPSTPTGRSVASVLDKSKLLSFTLLHFANGGGLNVEYCFTREDSFYGAGMNSIKLVLHNTTNLPLTNVRVGEQRLEDGMQLQPFGEVATLEIGRASCRERV